MRLILGTLTGLALAVAAPAAVSAQAGINVGMAVTDASGAPVGTVTAINGDSIVVKTGRHEALLPKTSFTVSAGKLLFGMTQAQLDAEIDKSVAAAEAAIAAGATVKDPAGAAVGTIASIEDDNVTIALNAEKKFQVKRSGLRGNADGTVTIGLTAEQLEAQLEQAAGTNGK
jgi:preprotein translocase subunit YajC